MPVKVRQHVVALAFFFFNLMWKGNIPKAKNYGTLLKGAESFSYRVIGDKTKEKRPDKDKGEEAKSKFKDMRLI